MKYRFTRETSAIHVGRGTQVWVPPGTTVDHITIHRGRTVHFAAEVLGYLGPITLMMAKALFFESTDEIGEPCGRPPILSDYDVSAVPLLPSVERARDALLLAIAEYMHARLAESDPLTLAADAFRAALRARDEDY